MRSSRPWAPSPRSFTWPGRSPSTVTRSPAPGRHSKSLAASWNRWATRTRTRGDSCAPTAVASPSSAPSRPTSSANGTWGSWTFLISWSWPRASSARRRWSARRCARSSAPSCSTSSRTRPSSRWTCSPCFLAITRSPRSATRIRRSTGGGGPRPRRWSPSLSASAPPRPPRSRPSPCPPRGATTGRSWRPRTAWQRPCARSPPIRRASVRSTPSRPSWWRAAERETDVSRSPTPPPTRTRWGWSSTSCSACARGPARAASGARSPCCAGDARTLPTWTRRCGTRESPRRSWAWGACSTRGRSKTCAPRWSWPTTWVRPRGWRASWRALTWGPRT